MVQVETPYGPIRGKVSAQGVFAPEFDDCKAIAQRTGTPIQHIMAAAREAYSKNPK
jgi:uncharacterized protein (DUF111 family)